MRIVIARFGKLNAPEKRLGQQSGTCCVIFSLTDVESCVLVSISMQNILSGVLTITHHLIFGTYEKVLLAILRNHSSCVSTES
jgi:hypothetical protein